MKWPDQQEETSKGTDKQIQSSWTIKMNGDKATASQPGSLEDDGWMSGCWSLLPRHAESQKAAMTQEQLDAMLPFGKCDRVQELAAPRQQGTIMATRFFD